MLPEIKKWLRLAFCRLAPEAREDATAEAIAHCLLAYVRLHEQGRDGQSLLPRVWPGTARVKLDVVGQQSAV